MFLTECMKLAIAYMLLSWHYFITPHTLHFMLMLFHREISHADIFCLQIFPSITNCIMYFKTNADEKKNLNPIKR